ncbi:MAG TPA: NBR1-Ig-like domain-containing protein [Anaerolineales bacterium]|nr:NBR1-Ig-like domain-containing protein [Anaerolineales bacterium]
MKKHPIVLAIALIIGAMLACNLPSNATNPQNPDAILTAAALTVQAQLSAENTPTLSPANTATPIPSANTPTLTPVPSSTLPPAAPSATATSNCDNALFVTDVTYPDNTVVTASSTFTKTWRLQNVGSCSWTPSYALVFVSNNLMNGPTVQALSGNVNPGQTVDISVNLQAPSGNGTYTGNWGLRNASGVIFTHFYVQIVVNSGGGGGAFVVTHVSFNVTGSCPNFNLTVTVKTNGAGTVNLHRVFSDGGTDTAPKTLVFSGAGSQTINYGAVYFGVSHSSEWTDIYIDSPNHQQFGRATFTCP